MMQYSFYTKIVICVTLIWFFSLLSVMGLSSVPVELLLSFNVALIKENPQILLGSIPIVILLSVLTINGMILGNYNTKRICLFSYMLTIISFFIESMIYGRAYVRYEKISLGGAILFSILMLILMNIVTLVFLGSVK